jgi:hypothetical protein
MAVPSDVRFVDIVSAASVGCGIVDNAARCPQSDSLLDGTGACIVLELAKPQ